MSKLAVVEFEQIWQWQWIKRHLVRFAGIKLHLLLRTLFGVFWLAAGINKVYKDWLTTDILKDIYLDRLTEMPPDAFASLFLQYFAIPLYMPIAWFITVGEIAAGLGLLLGLFTRPAAVVSFFFLVGFAIGGYYDASLIPFFMINVMLLCWPSGLWLGVDRRLAKNNPSMKWCR